MSEDKHERVKEKIAKLNKQITKLKEELEDLNKIRHGMNLEQIFLEVVEISKSIRIDVDGFDDPYLEAQIYASICNASNMGI
jgi:predicted translin family RNA/ssDNA-binding protein